MEDKLYSTVQNIEEFSRGSVWRDIVDTCTLNRELMYMKIAEKSVDEREADHFRGRIAQINDFLALPDQLLKTKLEELMAEQGEQEEDDDEMEDLDMDSEEV